MDEPPDSAAALADQTGSTYHLPEAAKGLSACPPVVDVLLEDELLDEDEELELELLLDELLEELDELELLLEELDEEELLDELLLATPELEDELLDDELALLLELLEVPGLIITPPEGISTTRSSRAPSSRLLIRSV